MKEFKAMHEEDFWSSWLREDERGREERKARTGRAKQGLVKEDVRILFLWKPLKFLTKGEIWRVAEMFLERPLGGA